MSEEEKEELQELINLLYNGHISQYGKRKLEEYIKKLQKELDKIREVEMEVIKENTCLGEKVDEQARMIDKLQKENEELKTINSMQKYRIEVIDERELISKDKIRKFIKEELPDDEIMECCETYDSNGVYLRKKLEELLEDNK